MTEFPETRASLILRVKDSDDREAWEQFVRIYEPIIYRTARSRGMQDADALDLTQQVLFSVAKAIPNYHRSDESSKFRHWLRRITRNAIINAVTRSPRETSAGGGLDPQVLAGAETETEEIERLIEFEHRRELFLRASDEVRLEVSGSTWKAFEMSVVGGCDVQAVAESLRLSVGAVYTARSRVMMRLQEKVRGYEEELR